MQNETLYALLGPSADPVAAGWQLRELAENKDSDAASLLWDLSQTQALVARSDPAILGGLLHVIHFLAMQTSAKTDGSSLVNLDPETIASVDQSLDASTPNRHLLLHLLAAIQSEQSLSLLLDRLDDAPPKKWMDAAQSLSPLMQNSKWRLDWFFSRALGLLQFPSLAATVIDLANFTLRTGKTETHPAMTQIAMLNHLLGEVGNRLGEFEENPRVFGDDVETVQATLGEAVALAVSLCDAVGLIGDPSSIAKLNRAMELKHRRVQCEAAGALARFDDDFGKKRLLELVADPAARLRAIAYADELGLGDSVDEQYRSDTATAEAEMSLWLTQPQQMGVPPTSLEVIESRRLLWPSFIDPVDVHLVRFEYSFGDKCYSNVGMAGPVTFAFSCDVADLPVDDIYAIYAGWHADHPEIFSVPSEQFNMAQQRAMQTFVKHLASLDYEELNPALLGFFLDEQAGVFNAVRDSTACVVVTDGLETIDHATAGRLRPLGPVDLFNLFKGRKMLRTFNS